MARRRGGASRVLARRQPVRRWAAPRHRRRPRRSARRSSPGVRRGLLRRAGPDARPHGHDRRRRLQGLADPSRLAPGEAWRERRGRSPHRRGRALGRSRARRPVRPSRCPRRRRRELCRPAVAASATGCPRPSAGARGAARTGSSGSCADAGAPCRRVASRAGARACPCPCASADARGGDRRGSSGYLGRRDACNRRRTRRRGARPEARASPSLDLAEAAGRSAGRGAGTRAGRPPARCARRPPSRHGERRSAQGGARGFSSEEASQGHRAAARRNTRRIEPRLEPIALPGGEDGSGACSRRRLRSKPRGARCACAAGAPSRRRVRPEPGRQKATPYH